MKSLVKKILQSWWAVAAVSALVLFCLHPVFFIEALKLGPLAGADTGGHMAIGKYYAEHIFPSAWGWAPLWYGGMPFPQYYPPLFFMVTAVLYKLLPFSYEHIVSGITLFLTLLTPGLLAWFVKIFTKNVYAMWVTALTTVLAVATFGYVDIGLTLEGNFNLGLITQLFGFFCLVIWLRYFLDKDASQKNTILSIVWLTLTLISNTFIVPIAFTAFVIDFIYSVRNEKHVWKQIKKYQILGGIPLLAVAFWYVPLLVYYKYALTTPPSYQLSLAFMLRWTPLILSIVVGMLPAYKNKNRAMVVVSATCVALLLPALLRFDVFFTALPLQTYRFLGVVHVLGLVIVGYVVATVSHRMIMREKAVVIFLTLFIFSAVWLSFPKQPADTYLHPEISTIPIAEVKQALSGETGMLVVESGNEGRVISNSVMPEQRDDNVMLRNAYIVFAEATPQSLLYIPIKDLISDEREITRVPVFLSNNRDFMQRNSTTTLNRLRMMGVTHMLIKNPVTVEKFMQSDQLSHQIFGEWVLFTMKAPAQAARVLRYEPTVFFGPATFKKRSIDAYDYMRFQEELLYRASPDLVIAHAHNQLLDETSDLDRFSSAIITSYQYSNADKAYEKLVAYSKNHTLILVSDFNPLFDALRLYQSDNPNIIFIDRLARVGNSMQPLRRQIQSMYDILDTRKISVQTSTTIRNVALTTNSIAIDLDTTGAAEVPVLMNVSYFPAWKTSTQEKIYMATPVGMLVYAQDDMVVSFSTPPSVKIGYIITLMTIAISVGYYVMRKKKISILGMQQIH